MGTAPNFPESTEERPSTGWEIGRCPHFLETVACTVKLGARCLDGTFAATILSGDSPEAFNDVERPKRVVPEKTQLQFNQGVVNLPTHSLTIVRGSAP